MMRRRFPFGGLALLLALPVAFAQASDDATIARLGVSGRTNATPSIAARRDFVAVAWGATAQAGASDVYVAVSRNGGEAFAPPTRVNDQAGEARNGGEMPPRVVLVPAAGGADPDIVVVWRAKSPTTSIRYARSRDGGRTFEPAVSVQSPDASGERGWQTAAVAPDGAVHAVWLDHRGLASEAGGGAVSHAQHRQAAAGTGFDGVAMAQRSGLYYAALGNGRSAERELAKGVCYCCKTALAAGANGTLYAAWRHVYDGNIRDIAFIASPDGGRSFGEPARVSDDHWQLAGCPDDGPAMTLGADGIVHLAWPTVIGGENPEGAIFYASSRDGRTFTPRLRVPTLGGPKPSHPQLAVMPDGRVAVAWDETRDGHRQAAVTTLTTDGPRIVYSPPIVLEPLPLAAVYPALASSAHHLVAAWTSGTGETSTIAVRRLASR